MRKFGALLILSTLFTTTQLQAEQDFQSFTGKIVRDKVRVRLQPNLEGQILHETKKGDMVVVTCENDEFYGIKPSAEQKFYIYRTYVLDGVVEGTKVNVRLKPDIDSPVVAQLNTGDRVQGTVCEENPKWLEIAAPDEVSLFIAKEFIENVGDSNLLANLDRRKEEVSSLLEATISMGLLEIEKPFEQISVDDINRNLDVVICDYSEFHEEVAKAKEFKDSLNNEYTQMKIAYLENKAYKKQPLIKESVQVAMEEKKVESTPHTFNEEKTSVAQGFPVKVEKPKPIAIVDPYQEPWVSKENEVFSQWIEENKGKTLSDFYACEAENAITLKGVIEPYLRPVRNKPGNYVLLNRMNHLPVAFLYSTAVNLASLENKEATLKVVERPNNNFAFPAYYVLSVE